MGLGVSSASKKKPFNEKTHLNTGIPISVVRHILVEAGSGIWYRPVFGTQITIKILVPLKSHRVNIFYYT